MGALTLRNHMFLKFESWELEKVTLPSLITIFPTTLKVYVKNEIFIKRLIRLQVSVLEEGYYFISIIKQIDNFVIREKIFYNGDFDFFILLKALSSNNFSDILERFSYYFVEFKFIYLHDFYIRLGKRKRKKRIDIKREKRKKRWLK